MHRIKSTIIGWSILSGANADNDLYFYMKETTYQSKRLMKKYEHLRMDAIYTENNNFKNTSGYELFAIF